MDGSGFLAGEPVNIYWNSVGGTKLATATGPSFSVAVKIPKVANGTYYIIADAPGTRASNAFRVTNAASPNVTPANSGKGGAPAQQIGTGGNAGNAGSNTGGNTGGVAPPSPIGLVEAPPVRALVA